MNRPPPEELLREHAQPDWSEVRQARVKARIEGALAEDAPSAPGRRWIWVSGGALATVAALVLALSGSERLTPDRPLPAAAVSTRLELPDGSWMQGVEPTTRFELTTDEAELVELDLAEGRVEVQVRPNPARLFRVRAGEVSVEVLGTRFIVERRLDRVDVEVVEGRVRVGSGEKDVVLGPGEHTRFVDGAPVRGEAAATDPDRNQPEAAPKSGPHSRPKRGRRRGRVSTEEPAWKRLAEQGDWAGASRRISDDLRFRSIEERMLAADALRLAGEPQRAFRVLLPVVESHPKDPRAPLALFTQGRLLLDELGRPRDAALLFIRLQTRYPDSSLLEDALAREVEAWSKAGASERARQGAERYLRRFPDGHRTRSVRAFGGLKP